MDIGQRIKRIRLEKHLTQDELAFRIDTTKQTIYKYENGIVTNIPASKIEAIANVLNTTPEYLMGWDNKLKSPTVTSDVVEIPVIGTIATGYNELANEDWSGETVSIPKEYLKGRKIEEFFVLTVHGDSMYPLYMNGDKVLILKQSTLNKSGDIGAILYDGEIATLKKVEYVQGEDWMKLIPINPEYQPKTIEGADLELCRVLGIPKLLIREINE